MAHIALFYKDETDLWSKCAAFLEQMLAENGRYLYLTDSHAPHTVLQNLTPQSGSVLNGDVVPVATLGYHADIFRFAPVVAALEDQLTKTLKQHSQMERLVCLIEMSWAIRTPSGAVYLREYEAALEELCERWQEKRSLTIVCLYHQQVMLDRQLLTALHTHATLFTSQGLVPNPHFVPPPIFASRNQRQQFDHWLAELDPESADGDEETAVSVPAIYNIDAEPALIANDGQEGRWKIRCFGGLRVYRADGRLIQWNVVTGATRKTKTLFAFLLRRGDAGATAEEIADLLWPNAKDHKQSLNRLYHTVRCLRMALSPNLRQSRQSPFVLYQGQRYFLALPPDSWIDMPMFEEICYNGRSHMKQQNWDEALLCYQSAERLYTGDLFADIPDIYAANRDIDWCWSRRYWYRDMYVKVLVNSAEIYRHTDRIPAALAACDKALHLDPTNESAHHEKMRTLAAANRQDALDRQFRLFQRVLRQQQLGELSPTTKSLYQLLKN